MSFLFHRSTIKAMKRRKTLAEAQGKGGEDGDNSDGEGGGSGGGGLRRTLTAIDLVLYGVGSSVGAGIFVLVGLGAKIAGPAISVSFLGCGVACILTSLAYAEFASSIPAAGSAFTYVYVAFGEFYAWIVGWNLILGYGFTASVAARAWGDYLIDLILKLIPTSNRQLRHYIQQLSSFHLFQIFTTTSTTKASSSSSTSSSSSPWSTAMMDLSSYTCSPLSIVIIAVSTYVLSRGAKDSSRFSNAVTILNLGILSLVIIAGITSESITTENLVPFTPHGVTATLQGAGLVFFAFIGFDMVASLSEEVVHPEKNMPIGIVGSLICTTCIYVSVSLAVVGMAPYSILGETVPVVNALLANACCSHEEQIQADAIEMCLLECDERHYVHPYLGLISHIVGGGAIFGLKASCFTSLMGQPRIFYRMAQDGLWFPIFAKIDSETQVPLHGIYVTGIATSFLACFIPLEALANLISLGTLMVFTFVNAGVIVLRLQTTLESLSIKIDHNDTTNNPLHQKQQRSHQQQHLYHQRKALARRKSNTLVYLLLLFVGSLLAASMLVSSSAADSSSSSSSSSWRVALCLLVAAATSISILKLPHTWSPPKTTATTQRLADGDATNGSVTITSNVHDHLTAKFQCPWVPMVPLGGIACNTFMMGSLPASSWFLCLVWLACGVGVYFVYGIHHSALGHKERYATDTMPLLPGGRSTYDGYESTLNVTMPEYHDHHHADRDPSYQKQQLIQ